MKYVAVILTFLFVFSCKEKAKHKTVILEKTKSSAELDKLRYEFLNQILNEDIRKDSIEGINESNLYQISLKNIELPENRITNEELVPPPLFYFQLKYDSLFLEQDSLFYKSQANDLKNFQFDKKLISKKLNYIDQEELQSFSKDNHSDFWENFNNKYPNTCIKTISVPFFNKEKNICIATYSYGCGSLWGNGFTGVYKKENGKWKLLETSDYWVS